MALGRKAASTTVDESLLVREPTILLTRYVGEDGKEELYPIETLQEIKSLSESNKRFKPWILTRDVINVPRKLLYKSVSMGIATKNVAAYSSGSFASYLNYVIRFYSG